MEYQFTPQCRSITGLHDAYELQARNMVIAGMIYFDNHPEDVLTIRLLKTPFEITTHLPVLFKSLMDAATEMPAPEHMAHILANLKFAIIYGWEPYIYNMERFEKRDYSIKDPSKN